MRRGRRWRAGIGAAALALLAACGQSPDLGSAEPALATSPALLDAALRCTPFEHPERPVVLLVHGTFLTGPENYSFSYLPLLAQRGYDVCTVTYPDRGLGDIQTSAEYVVHAVQQIHAQTGRRLALIGWSQGVEEMRCAIKWWPSVRAVVDDLVSLAGPNHGGNAAYVTSVAQLFAGLPFPVKLLPEVIYQLRPDSQFITALNAGDETPGDIDYTSLYTQFDEIVRPVQPVPTAALDFGDDNPRVTNLLLQDLCPLHIADHLTVGISDRMVFELALDAISHPGPADIERAGGTALCGLLPIVPAQILAPPSVAMLIDLLQVDQQAGVPALHLAGEEPPLRAYAR